MFITLKIPIKTYCFPNGKQVNLYLNKHNTLKVSVH